MGISIVGKDMLKHAHLLLSQEERLALRLLATAYGITMSRMVAKLVMDAYSKQKFQLPKKKMSKIKKLVKQWG